MHLASHSLALELHASFDLEERAEREREAQKCKASTHDI
jgi:hypothetical protein